MNKTAFYTVIKIFAQAGENGAIYGHEFFTGLEERAAKAKYHELLNSTYASGDPYAHVFIVRDDGVMVFGELDDRRIVPEPNTAI